MESNGSHNAHKPMLTRKLNKNKVNNTNRRHKNLFDFGIYPPHMHAQSHRHASEHRYAPPSSV